MKNLLLIFIGGGLGSMSRYLVGKMMTNLLNIKNFPLGTFTANILGCLLIGVILGWFAKNSQVDKAWSLLFATGFCGGFTTFSTFSQENIILIQKGEIIAAIIYMGLSLLVGLAACGVGLYLMK